MNTYRNIRLGYKWRGNVIEMLMHKVCGCILQTMPKFLLWDNINREYWELYKMDINFPQIKDDRRSVDEPADKLCCLENIGSSFCVCLCCCFLRCANKAELRF